MSYAEIRDLAMQLSEADRDRLAEELVVSVPRGNSSTTGGWPEELDRRVAALESGQETARPVGEFLAELRGEIDSRLR